MKKLKIGLDARFALGKRRGIGNYSLDLFRAMTNISDEFEFIFFSDRQDTECLLRDLPNSKVRVIGPAFYPFWEQISLPIALKRDQVQIFHAVGNTGPILLPKEMRRIVTIHDVMFLKSLHIVPESPSLYQRLGRFYRSVISPPVALRANLVLTVSNFSRQDILDSILGLDPRKVEVIYNGLPSHFKHCPEPGEAHPLQGQNYLLHLGALDPRKNTSLVVRSYLALKRQHLIDEHLVILGLANLDALDLSDEELKEGKASIHTPGFVTDEIIPVYFRHSRAFLFPSLYEGFGIPLLEAMSCGTPIITSNSTCLPEIAGGATLLVNPRRADEFEKALLTLLDSVDLRTSLITKGLCRIKDFSWEAIATKTLESYKHIMHK